MWLKYYVKIACEEGYIEHPSDVVKKMGYTANIGKYIGVPWQDFVLIEVEEDKLLENKSFIIIAEEETIIAFFGSTKNKN